MTRPILLTLGTLLFAGCRTPDPATCEFPPPFGSVVVGASAEAELRCTSAGAFEILSVEVAVPFSAQIVDRALVRVSYAPIAPGLHEADLTITWRGPRGEDTILGLVNGTGLTPLDWDAAAPDPACTVSSTGTLLTDALALTGLDLATFGFDDVDLSYSSYAAGGFLADSFLLSWFEAMRGAPGLAGCFERETAGPLDHYLTGDHPVAESIRHAARLLDRGDQRLPIDARVVGDDVDAALTALCDLGDEACWFPGDGLLPDDLGRALAPIVWAMVEGVAARQAIDAAGVRDPDWWQRNGGHLTLIPFGGERPDITDADDVDMMLGAARAQLYAAAAQIAHAVESTDWSTFEGRPAVRYDLRTPFGWLRVRGAEDDTYPAVQEETLLLVDLGGNDDHLDPVATNRSGTHPVAIVIDLAGADHYHYEIRATPFDAPGLPPADEAGRYPGDADYGPISRSDISRQGAGRNGIAMLFDFGSGDDRYASLRMSQGYAHNGVGVLFDAGGNDSYVAEAGVQGSAQFGIGLLIDAGAGADDYRAFTHAQGFGFSGGVGIALDGGGPDRWKCDHGDPTRGGIRLYASPQLPLNGNSSFCQGAGFGLRGDASATFFSGGLGLLRDLSGDDVYEASVFAQGAGYWQGTGLLSDGDGADAYDAYWYVQGAAAHYAVGILTDGGDGTDVFDGVRPTRNMSLGAGHDYSVGVLVNEFGDDEYHLGTLSAGSSNCNGVGLFVDNAGDDQYLATSDYNSGMGNVSGECIDTRPDAVSIGVMIDAGGTDVYSYPPSSFVLPSEGGTWGHARNALPSEHGAGIDGSSESGVHAGTVAP